MPMFLLKPLKSEMPHEDQFPLYEVNENGERVIVKSQCAEKHAYIRFINRTSSTIKVWWRDYNGRRVFYVNMKPFSFYNADTFITHPWEFSDAYTGERYVINNKYIFRPPDCLANMTHRTNWYISVPVRSLLRTAMITIALRLRSVEQVEALELPKPLAEDLKILVNDYKTPLPALLNAPPLR